MAKKDMKRCSTSLMIRKLSIKTTKRYRLSLVRMAIIKKSTNKAEKGTQEREFSCIVGGNINWYNHYEKQYGGSLELKFP